MKNLSKQRRLEVNTGLRKLVQRIRGAQIYFSKNGIPITVTDAFNSENSSLQKTSSVIPYSLKTRSLVFKVN